MLWERLSEQPLSEVSLPTSLNAGISHRLQPPARAGWSLDGGYLGGRSPSRPPQGYSPEARFSSAISAFNSATSACSVRRPVA